jgi:hypothetical protein
MKLTRETGAVLGKDRRMPPGRSMIGGGTELYRGRLADALNTVLITDPADYDLLWLHVDTRDLALRWNEIEQLLRNDDLLD